MSNRKQIVFSLALVAVAAASVAIYGRVGRESEQVTSGAGREGMPGTAEAQEEAAGGIEGATPVYLTDESARRIGVTYAVAVRKPLVRSVRAVGIVSYDETRLATVNPKIEGWVERLSVDFTGAPVRLDEPLLEIYSPRLVSAQEELILARRLRDEAAAGSRAAANAEELLESARRRLAYWDIPPDEIARIEESGEVSKTLTLRAPATGIVVEKNVVVGAMIAPGMNVYRIADLSRVWIEAEIFEKDLSLVQVRQRGGVTFDAFPGEEFDGVVTYVYPNVSLDARTGRIRLELANPGLRLRPGMYANVEIQVTAPRAALQVPRSAVLLTGQRAMVFVRAEDGALVPRQVTPGLVAGDMAEILSGLEEGEVIVSSANFLIDAESNLGAAMAGMAGMEGMEIPAVQSTRSPAGSDARKGAPPRGPETTDLEALRHSGHLPPGSGVSPSPASGHQGHGAPVARRSVNDRPPR